MQLILLKALYIVLDIMKWAIFARVILSWLPMPRENKFISILYQVTEPILSPIRNFLQNTALGRGGMMDFSPLIAFILLEVIQNFL